MQGRSPDQSSPVSRRSAVLSNGTHLTRLGIPALVGFALAFFGTATINQFGGLLQPKASLTPATLLAILMSLGIGMYLPTYFARAFSRLTARYRYQPDPRQLSEPGQQGTVITDAQLRIIGAGCLVLAGLATLAVNLLAGQLREAYNFAIETFHWTKFTLHVLEVGMLFAYVAVPVGLIGMALNCLQRITLLHSRYPLTTLICLTAGLSLGVATGLFDGVSPPAAGTLLVALLLLGTGLAQLRTPDLPALDLDQAPDLPSESDRWRFVLVWMLVLAGLLITLYLLAWQIIFGAGVAVPMASIHILGLLLGLVLSAILADRFHQPLHGVALTCILSSLLTTASLRIASSAISTTLAGAGNPTHSAWVLLLTSLPLVLMGMAVGSAMVAVAERSVRAASAVLSSTLSVCLGAIAASAVLVFELFPSLTFFERLVLLVLLWLAGGGLLLIYEPRFSLRARWPQASCMVLTLLAVTILLPEQAPQWSRLFRQMNSGRTCTLQLIGSHAEADRILEQIQDTTAFASAAENHTQPSFGPGSLSASSDGACLQDILLELHLSKEQHAAIIINLPAQFQEHYPRQLQAAVIRAAAGRLRGDGILVTRLAQRETVDRDPAACWREQLQESFGRVELVVPNSPKSGAAMTRRYLLAWLQPRQQTTVTALLDDPQTSQ